MNLKDETDEGAVDQSLLLSFWESFITLPPIGKDNPILTNARPLLVGNSLRGECPIWRINQKSA